MVANDNLREEVIFQENELHHELTLLGLYASSFDSRGEGKWELTWLTFGKPDHRSSDCWPYRSCRDIRCNTSTAQPVQTAVVSSQGSQTH